MKKGIKSNIAGPKLQPLCREVPALKDISNSKLPKSEDFKELTNSNSSTKNNLTMPTQCQTLNTQQATTCSGTNNTAACGTVNSSFMPPSNMTLEQRVSLLEQNYDRLSYRLEWQETLHRNVTENGNITHYYNIIPSIVIAGGVGAIVGFGIARAAAFIFKKRD